LSLVASIRIGVWAKSGVAMMTASMSGRARRSGKRAKVLGFVGWLMATRAAVFSRLTFQTSQRAATSTFRSPAALNVSPSR